MLNDSFSQQMGETEKNITENLQAQLDELESLQAMFYNPGEIKIEDIGVVQDIKDYILGRTKVLPPCLDFTINLVIDENKFEMCVSLSHEYPFVKPDVFVRNHRLDRTQHVKLNKKIGEFLSELPEGEPCVFAAISWLQDNASEYTTLENLDNTMQKNVSREEEELLRYWIYSHHIYSQTKRRALIDLANQLKVTGFVMPGKPGIICVEGDACDVIEWWQTVKNMNWKKIFCKITESSKEDIKYKTFLKFEDFKELVFDNHGPKYNHMDMGEFYKYLDKRELGHIFKDIFGVEAKSG